MTNILDTVEPDAIVRECAGCGGPLSRISKTTCFMDGKFNTDDPIYSRETVERLLAKRTVWAVYHSEDYVGSFVQGLFSSEERAQSWIDNQSNWPKDECFIAVMEIDDELRRMASEPIGNALEGEK